jgi:putative acetyltransferase
MIRRQAAKGHEPPFPPTPIAMKTPLIRPEMPADVAALAAVTEAAFLDAPHTDHNEQFILAGLREAGALTIALVDEVDGIIVGHVALSPVSLSDRTPAWFGPGPLSVVPRWQGRGIGSALIKEALERLSARGASGCVVLGDPAYYRRFGFANDAGLVLHDVPPEYFMALSFRPPAPRGTVAYHAAFGATR